MQGSWSKNIWWNLISSSFRMIEAIRMINIVKVFLLTLVVAAIAQSGDTILIQIPLLFWILIKSLFGSSIRHRD